MSAPCPMFGFPIVVDLDARSAQHVNALSDDLIQFLGQNGLSAERTNTRGLEFVVSRDGAQATHAD